MLIDQEATIKRLESHVCPHGLCDSTPNTQMFNLLVSRIGTKGILKMLAER